MQSLLLVLERLNARNPCIPRYCRCRPSPMSQTFLLVGGGKIFLAILPKCKVVNTVCPLDWNSVICEDAGMAEVNEDEKSEVERPLKAVASARPSSSNMASSVSFLLTCSLKQARHDPIESYNTSRLHQFKGAGELRRHSLEASRNMSVQFSAASLEAPSENLV